MNLVNPREWLEAYWQREEDPQARNQLQDALATWPDEDLLWLAHELFRHG